MFAEPLTAFADGRKLTSGTAAEVARLLAARGDNGRGVIITDAGGRAVDLNLAGGPDQAASRYAAPPAPRGRPKLGVEAREVTLLPQQWEWLASQPGGASASLRRLIDAARKDPAAEAKRQARAHADAATRFMGAAGGDLPGYEAATRALYQGDRAGLEQALAPWPRDLRDHALKLAFG